MGFYFALIVTFTIMVLGVAGGIEKANKIMIPLFFLMILGLVIYVRFQPGSSRGYEWMFTIDPEILKNPMMRWDSPSFLCLWLAMYGSYLPDKEDIVNSAWKVALFDTMAAIFAALLLWQPQA